MSRELPPRSKGPLRVRLTGDPAHEARRDPRPGQTGYARGVDLGASRTPPLRLLRFPAVRERTGLSRSTIWRLERRGEFPRHRRISANAVAWIEQEIVEWITSRASGVAV